MVDSNQGGQGGNEDVNGLNGVAGGIPQGLDTDKLEIRKFFGYVAYRECNCYSFCLDVGSALTDGEADKGPVYPMEFGYETTYHGLFRFTPFREAECESLWRGGQATGIRGRINLMDVDNPYGPNYDPNHDLSTEKPPSCVPMPLPRNTLDVSSFPLDQSMNGVADRSTMLVEPPRMSFVSTMDTSTLYNDRSRQVNPDYFKS